MIQNGRIRFSGVILAIPLPQALVKNPENNDLAIRQRDSDDRNTINHDKDVCLRVSGSTCDHV
jgi:hypothetical protein